MNKLRCFHLRARSLIGQSHLIFFFAFVHNARETKARNCRNFGVLSIRDHLIYYHKDAVNFLTVTQHSLKG